MYEKRMSEERNWRTDIVRTGSRSGSGSLRTRWVKHYIDRTTDSPKCRMCEKMDENVSHIVSDYNEDENETQTW